MRDEPITRRLDQVATRRGFLLGLGAATVAAACSNGEGSGAAGGTTTSRPVAGTPEQSELPIQGGVATGDLWAGEELRVPFGLLRSTEDGTEELFGPPVSIGFTGPDGSIAPRPATRRDAGLEGRVHEGIYTATATFPTPGVWEAHVDVEGEEGAFAFQVHDAPRNPSVGDDAIVTPSPTPAEPLGVDPICTRDPQCPFHEVSLDDALGTGAPVLLMFATPARCMSRWCGPVVDVLIDSVEADRDGLTAVHVEIYQDLRTNDRVPTVAEWGLTTEPILYGIDGSGTITRRLDGAFDRDELRGVVGDLTS